MSEVKAACTSVVRLCVVCGVSVSQENEGSKATVSSLHQALIDTGLTAVADTLDSKQSS